MRAIALVVVLSLSVVSALGGPHLHPSPDGNRTACATCDFRLNPHQAPVVVATSPTLILTVEEVRVVLELAPRAERCLTRAPKQGPPAA